MIRCCVPLIKEQLMNMMIYSRWGVFRSFCLNRRLNRRLNVGRTSQWSHVSIRGNLNLTHKRHTVLYKAWHKTWTGLNTRLKTWLKIRVEPVFRLKTRVFRLKNKNELFPITLFVLDRFRKDDVRSKTTWVDRGGLGRRRRRVVNKTWFRKRKTTLFCVLEFRCHM